VIVFWSLALWFFVLISLKFAIEELNVLGG
jgi:hypothetical protein